MRVTRMERETADVVSLYLEQPDAPSLRVGLPGQFLVLRLRTRPDGPVLLRNYSMSDVPGAGNYRVSVKCEMNGAVSSYLHNHVQPGDVLEVSAPRGGFTLESGDAPVVLLSAGIGVTPLLAMLPDEQRDALAQSVNFPKRLGNPAEYGDLIVHIARNSYLNGEVIRLDGGIRMPPK